MKGTPLVEAKGNRSPLAKRILTHVYINVNIVPLKFLMADETLIKNKEPRTCVRGSVGAEVAR